MDLNQGSTDNEYSSLLTSSDMYSDEESDSTNEYYDAEEDKYEIDLSSLTEEISKLSNQTGISEQTSAQQIPDDQGSSLTDQTDGKPDLENTNTFNNNMTDNAIMNYSQMENEITDNPDNLGDFEVQSQSMQPVLHDNSQLERDQNTEKEEGGESVIRMESEFINKLGLTPFYPERITPMDVIRIKSKPESPSYTDIPWIVLRNLMMINSNSRDKLVEDFLQIIPVVDGSPDDTGEFSDDEDWWSDIGMSERHVHCNPMDLITAIFMCASPVLKNILASKLFMCKLAIPLLLPKEDILVLHNSLLHAFAIDNKIAGKVMSQKLAINCLCQTVAFVRFGRPSFSKSYVLNSILFSTYHDTFFNRNCSLGSTERIISDGIMEVAWYISSGKTSTFENTITFFNLRGDCHAYQKQLQLLPFISDVVVVCIELSSLIHEDFMKILRSMKSDVTGGIMLAIDALNSEEKAIQKVRKEFKEKLAKDRQKIKLCLVSKNRKMENTHEVKKRLCSQISELLRNVSLSTISSRFEKNLPSFVVKDKEASLHRLARERVSKLERLIPKNIATLKETIAPLQGKLWHSWSKNLKIIHKSSHSSLHDRDKFVQEMKKARYDQFGICRHINEFMSVCLNILLGSLENESEFILLIEWIKLTLDDRSRNASFQCLLKYQSNLQKLNQAKQDKDTEVTLEALEREVTESRAIWANSTFRFEHIMREIGQMYEAFVEFKNEITEEEKNFQDKLSTLGAKLLLIGHPFEIMDGDAGNVPLLWVKAVLFKLKEIVGEKKVLSLSVVGIQSSGKSTLLNTMFGLQFSVSAGCCTRGVFMQLIPVQEEQFRFEYVFVIDTEGLRAPEQVVGQTQNNDNKLATFVIGLGDIAIVNVKGENVSEIKDILQIAVHAFLRLKLVNRRLNLKQGCIFIHQNVAPTDAEEKTEERHVFVESLDKMTKDAVEQENIADIQTFTQVIDFDSEQNVTYLSDLWYGDPPMAPANPCYSRRVAEVKESIVYRLSSKRKTFLTLTDSIARIEDLWNGILKDDFVYSFRNTLELKAYRSMERKYHSIVLEMEKEAREFRITKAKNEFLKCKSEEQLEKTVTRLVLFLTREMDKKVEEVSAELRSFVENSKLREVMIQWEQTKLNRLKLISEKLVIKSKTEMNNKKEEIRICKIQNEEQVKHEAESNDLAQKLAIEMKGETATEEIMKKNFENMWISWLNKFNEKQIDDKELVRDQIEQLLCLQFSSDLTYMDREMKNKINYQEIKALTGSIKIENVSDEHISVRQNLNAHVKTSSMDEYKEQALDLINKIFRKIDQRLNDISEQDVSFDISYASEILNIVENEIAIHNQNESGQLQFTLPSTFRALIINHVVCYITVVFTRLHEKYNNKHSPRGQINSYKVTMWNLFKDLVESKTEDLITLGMFREAIVKAVTEHVMNLIPYDNADNIIVALNQEKYELMKNIMIDLAKKNNFQEYKEYIEDPATYAKKWLQDFANHKIFYEEVVEGSRYFLFAKFRIDSIFVEISKNSRQVRNIQEGIQRADIASTNLICQWIDLFVKAMSISNVLPLSNEMFVHVSRRTVSDILNFEQILIDEIENIKQKVYSNFKNENSASVKWQFHPISLAMNKLWGCKEVCMFCKEPCKMTDVKHLEYNIAHQCIQHRPHVIGGLSHLWNGRLVVDFCNALIQDDSQRYKMGTNQEFRLYKNYKKEFPTWDIQSTYDTSKYWMWVMCTYECQLREHYHAPLPDIPKSWYDITKEEAIDSL